jgi:hypothetical protein
MRTRKSETEALRRLHQEFPELLRLYDRLVIPPTQHFLRCFVFEGTVDQATVYLWRVVMPLYRPPLRFLILNYGDRLLNGERIDLANFDIERVVRAISDEGLGWLRRICTPSDFLERIDWKSRPRSPNYLLDFALSRYLASDASGCLEVLEEMGRAKWRPVWADTVSLASELAEELKTDRTAFDQRINGWERRNFEIFGLAPRRRPKVLQMT